MSAKNLDKTGRLRSITVGFRVSDRENEMINEAVRLSGMLKQEYLLKKALDRDIAVVHNVKTVRAVQVELRHLLNVLRNPHCDNVLTREDIGSCIRLILHMLGDEE